MRRTAAALVASLVAAVGLVALAPPALAAADTWVSIPLTGFKGILYDDAHGHVFLTGGGSNDIVVVDAEGRAVGTIPNEPGASRMTLSDDKSTLYVALSSGQAISAIDTSTLTEVARYGTGPNTCPSTVAVTMGKIWFGYACGSGGGDLGVIDPTTTPPTVSLAQMSGRFIEAPGLKVSPSTPGLLAAGDFHSSSGALWLLDVSSGTPVTKAFRSVGDNLEDVSFSQDGTHVLTASGYPYQVPSFLTADLSPSGVYDSNDPYPNAVATGPGGTVAVGLDAAYSPDIRMYEPDGTFIRSYELGGCCAQGQSGSLAPGGLAWSADGSHLYAVSTDYVGGTVELRVLHDPTKAPSRIVLTPPSTATRNTAYDVSGSLMSTMGVPAGATLTVQRSSSYGTVALPSVTPSATGSFTIPDKVSQRGTYTYTVSYAGDASHTSAIANLPVVVHGLATTLTITTSAGPYLYGSRPLVVAHLGTTKVRTISLYATPYGGSRTLLKTGTVDSYGNLSTAYYLTRNTVFSAVFGGDDTYDPRSTGKLLATHARVATAVGGSYGTYGVYHLVHASTNPVIAMGVSPSNAGSCVSFVLQRYYSGAWNTVSSVSCVPLNSQGVAAGYIYGTHPAGTLNRVLATFLGSSCNVRTAAPWVYIEFTA